LFIATIAGYELRSRYAQEVSGVRIGIANTSFLLVEWLIGEYRTSDYVLQDIISQIPLDDLHYPPINLSEHAKTTKFLKSKLETLPKHFVGVGTADKNCMTAHTFNVPPRPSVIGFDGSERDWCTVHLQNNTPKYYVSPAFISNTGSLSVVQSRAFRTASNEFYGNVGFEMELDFFSKLIEKISIDKYGVIAIADVNLSLLARKPSRPKALGKKLNDEILEAFIASSENYKDFRNASPLDGENRFYGMRKVGSLPFVVIVGEADRDWLANWVKHIWGTVITVTILWVLAFLTHRYYWMKSSLLLQEVSLEKKYNEEQTQLLAILTHEIRTPLAVIDSATESLRIIEDREEHKNNDRVRRYDRIRKSVLQMSSTLEMGLSHIQSTNRSFEPDVTDIQSLTDDIINIAGSGIESQIRVDIPEEHALVAKVDSRLMSIAMLNLLSNAIKYSPSNSEVTVTCQQHTQDGVDGILWSVCDQGVGIATEEQDKIFQKGFRGHRTQDTSGLGLGLYLVKIIAQQHKGSVSVKNLPEHGAVFSLWFPL